MVLKDRKREQVEVEEAIARIIGELDSLGVAWCLIGAHAVGEYVEPRATLDVDLLVDDRRMAAILERLRDAVGELDEDDIGPAVRLRAVAVDLVRASSNDVFRAVLVDARTKGAWRLPTTEGLLVLKFMAATSPFRGVTRRRQDMVDLLALYEAVDPEALDRERMAELAAKVFPGAENELTELLRRVDAGEPITV